MKHWLLGLLCLFLIKPAYAFELEKRMYLTEHYLSYTSSFDVSTDERKLGTVYRRVLSLNTVYDFYDLQNIIISSAKSHFFSFGAHLDVFGSNNELLGTVEEKIFSWFPSFELYSTEGVRLATAKMNFWGTKFTLYDGNSDRVLGELSRNFFRIRNHWTIDIKDLDRVKERQIDARFLLTVLAIQGDLEYMRDGNRVQFNSPNPRFSAVNTSSFDNDTQITRNIRKKFADFLNKETELTQIDLPDSTQLTLLATQLDQDFQQQYAGMGMTVNEQTERFVEYCMNIAQASATEPSMQKAIIHLLNMRLAEQTGK